MRNECALPGETHLFVFSTSGRVPESYLKYPCEGAAFAVLRCDLFVLPGKRISAVGVCVERIPPERLKHTEGHEGIFGG